MDTAQIRTRLVEEQKRLREEIVALENEARESAAADVQDPIDMVTSDEAKAGAFEISTRRNQTLKEVENALLRLEEGDYGMCIDCGRPIEPARLDAVPWTPYCLADQEKHDREQVNESDLA
jgi:DnaK suppressor protein